MPPRHPYQLPDLLEDSTKEHFGILRNIIVEKYRKRNSKPFAVCEGIGEALLYDTLATVVRMAQRYRRLEDNIGNFK